MMQPVSKGPPPKAECSHYRDALDDLEDRIGLFWSCSNPCSWSPVSRGASPVKCLLDHLLVWSGHVTCQATELEGERRSCNSRQRKFYSTMRPRHVDTQLDLADAGPCRAAAERLGTSRFDQKASGPWGQLAFINGLVAVSAFTVRLLDESSAAQTISFTPVRGKLEPRSVSMMIRIGSSLMPPGERLADCKMHRTESVACERAGTEAGGR